jgi:hypothetical protein
VEGRLDQQVHQGRQEIKATKDHKAIQEIKERMAPQATKG